MAIPVYLWLKDDGGADIKGSVDVNDWEGRIGYTINDARQEVEYFNTKLENVKVVKVAPKMHDVKDPAKEKHNHLELVELRYEKIIWTYNYGLQCEVDDSLYDALVAACLLPDTGARNIDSLLNQQILPVLSQQLLQRQALRQPTQTVTLGYCENSGISLSFSDEHDTALLAAERA